ncbi:MAG: hypothetical protein EXR77_10115 [Myxococcales bacterium]|nr:hypothetical protein [Myxococcales bacterium]
MQNCRNYWLFMLLSVGQIWATACAQVASTADGGSDILAANGLDAGVEVDGSADPDSASDTDAAKAFDSSSDATKVADGQGIDADGVDPCADATPVSCFAGAPPSADACIAPLAKPNDSCPELATPEWFETGPVPAPTLNIELGVRDNQGVWHAYADGDWVAMLTASQGYFHFGLVPQVTLPGEKSEKIKLQFDAFATYGCEVVAFKHAAVKFMVPIGTSAVYTVVAGNEVLTVFNVSIAKKAQYCGLWYKVYFRVRLPGTDFWGQKTLYLRSYDSTAKPVVIPP